MFQRVNGSISGECSHTIIFIYASTSEFQNCTRQKPLRFHLLFTLPLFVFVLFLDKCLGVYFGIDTQRHYQYESCSWRYNYCSRPVLYAETLWVTDICFLDRINVPRQLSSELFSMVLMKYLNI